MEEVAADARGQIYLSRWDARREESPRIKGYRRLPLGATARARARVSVGGGGLVG